ncbi:nucleotide sugar dehydrogenase (plasmid) [Haloferacaceae archaeon DSL9]
MSSTHASEVSALYGSEATPELQREAFASGHVPVGVYGLGKMGLPLAAVYADVSGNVSGADVDQSVVDRINRGECHISGEPGLPELVKKTVEAGSFEAFSDPEVVASRSAVHVVIVPTLVTEDSKPDLSIISSVAEDIGANLDEGDIVIFESTLPPRSCEDVLLPILEERSGLSRGQFGLAFCPERTLSGRAIEDIREAHPKIVGGIDDESTRVAELIYGEITSNDVISVSDVTTAEAVKVFEGVYRDVNIGLANELARLTDELKIDVMEAIEAANTQPFCDIHIPGAGVGGHCIPYYPHFLIQQFDGDTRLMETARRINDSMPGYTADLALAKLEARGVSPGDANVLVLGLTYRPGVAEIRATPSIPAIQRLVAAGATVTAVDPVLDEYDAFRQLGATISTVDEIKDSAFDAVVLITPQTAFEDLDLPSMKPTNRQLVVIDGRQTLTALRDHTDIDYQGVGLYD